MVALKAEVTGHFVVLFPKKFQQTIQAQLKTGYRSQSTGKMNMIVYWKVDEGKEVRVALREVVFFRRKVI